MILMLLFNLLSFTKAITYTSSLHPEPVSSHSIGSATILNREDAYRIRCETSPPHLRPSFCSEERYPTSRPIPAEIYFEFEKRIIECLRRGHDFLPFHDHNKYGDSGMGGDGGDRGGHRGVGFYDGDRGGSNWNSNRDYGYRGTVSDYPNKAPLPEINTARPDYGNDPYSRFNPNNNFLDRNKDRDSDYSRRTTSYPSYPGNQDNYRTTESGSRNRDSNFLNTNDQTINSMWDYKRRGGDQNYGNRDRGESSNQDRNYPRRDPPDYSNRDRDYPRRGNEYPNRGSNSDSRDRNSGRTPHDNCGTDGNYDSSVGFYGRGRQ